MQIAGKIAFPKFPKTYIFNTTSPTQFSLIPSRQDTAVPAFSPTSPTFAARISHVVWTWRRLVAELGMAKSRGAGNKGCIISLIGSSASGAYAPGHMLWTLMTKKKNTQGSFLWYAPGFNL